MLCHSSKAMSKLKLQQNRHFISPVLSTALTTVTGIAYSVLGSKISLADKLERNEVHQNKTNNELEIEKLKKTKPLFKRPEKNYPNHIPLYFVEKMMLFVGSSLGAFLHPERNEFIVALGESTATPWFLTNLRAQMLQDPIGRQILRERPYITSDSLNLEKLSKYPANSFGRVYHDWLIGEGVSPDTRVDVRFIDDEELAFVFQRYRQCHDFYHALVGLPIVREGEIALKFFEYLNIGVPFAGLGALFAPIPIKKSQRDRLLNIYYPWAIKNAANCNKNLINVYWEKILDKNINELRKELNIEEPPNMRELRRNARKGIKCKKI